MPTLHKLRELAVLTQVELAEKVEVSSITVSHWETGSKRPRVSNIRKLATVLNVTPQEIIAALDEAALSRAQVQKWASHSTMVKFEHTLQR